MIVVVALALLAADPQPAGAVVTPPAAAKKEQRSIYVADLSTSSGVDPGTLVTITSSLASSVQKHAGQALKVLTSQDVKQIVDVEAQKQILGCDQSSASCIAELVNAVGVDLVLYGDVGKLGESYVINLTLFDTKKQERIGGQQVSLPKMDETLLAQIDIAVTALIAPITGEKTATSQMSTNGITLPTFSPDELKGAASLKSVNMKAEQARDFAEDTEQDKSASLEKKRDAWCSLQNVEGANPYLATATKYCEAYKQAVVANAQLESSMSADYQTLAGILDLKHRSKEEKLAAIDSFLQTYDRLADRPMVKSVKSARERLVTTGSASMGDRDHDGIPDDVDKCPDQPEDKDGFQDSDGCPDPDNDGDGILDKDDQCPDVPGVPEKHGCPRTAGEVASAAASATGDFLGNLVEITATQTSFILGAGLHADTTFAPLGGHLAPGADITFKWTAFTGGIRFDYDTQGGAPLLGANLGLRVLQIPKGNLGLIDPSIGVDVLGFPGGDIIAGPYAANTFKLSSVDIRVYYRYALYEAKSGELPPHEVGAQVTLNDSLDGLESLVKDSGTFLMTDTNDKDFFVGVTGNLDTTFAPPGGDLDLGFGMRVAYTFFELGGRVAFDLADTSGGHKTVFMGAYGGLQFFEIPKGDFALLRPSVGVDFVGNLDNDGGIIAGPYIANTFKLTNTFHVRVYYRYGLLSKGSNLPPVHAIGAEASVNLIDLFK
jgi:hypothetical protein